MADSSVPITAGSGTSIDTRTESANSNHRQVIVIGDPATNAGVAPVDATSGLKVSLGSDNQVELSGSGLTSLQLIDDVIFTDGAAYTPATSKALVIGAQADETAADSVDEGDAGALRMTLARALHANMRDDNGDSCMDNTNNSVKVSIVSDSIGSTVDNDDGSVAAGQSSIALTINLHYEWDGAAFVRGGCSTFMASASDGSTILQNTAQAIKASAGVLRGGYFHNHESAITYLHFYNTAAASVTVGTTNPLFTLPLPASAAGVLALPSDGVKFTNAGWSCAATTAAGTNANPSTGVSLVAWYL